MGLFDAFKKGKGETKAPPAPPAGALMKALIERFGLEPGVPPPKASLMGGWWERPPDDDLLLAFQESGNEIVAFLGEPVEITEIYLCRETPDKWRLGAGKWADFPELELPAVKAALAKLSPTVKDCCVYENRAGVSLRLLPGATPETIAADLQVAREMLRAVAGGPKKD